MPIRLLTRNRKPYAYQWGWHGTIYTISKYGKRGAYNKATIQAGAAHASGYKDRVSRNLVGEITPTGSQYDIAYEGRDRPDDAPIEYQKMWAKKKSTHIRSRI